jgi:hypothetical protein
MLRWLGAGKRDEGGRVDGLLSNPVRDFLTTEPYSFLRTADPLSTLRIE